MTWQAWVTLIVIAIMVVGLVRGLAGTDMILMAGLTLLVAAGIVTPQKAFAGFANHGMLIVGVMFVVAEGMRATGGMDLLVRGMLGQPRSLTGAQLRMILPVAGLSAVVNNTPLVAMMVPIVGDWSKRIGLSPSKLMMPLSYAAILGGTCTIIGTTTNLVVLGLATARFPDLRIGFAEIGWVGFPVLVVGVIYMLLAARALLPNRDTATTTLENAREYTVAMRVALGAPIVGRTIEQAGLRRLPGLFLVHIESADSELRPAPGPDVRLKADDRLLFSGILDGVLDLQKIRGLVSDEDQVRKLNEPRPNRRLIEAVVSAQSGLIGQTVRAGRFRTNYDAAIIAVHRQGERIPSKIGDIEIQAGDALLLEAHPSFVGRYRNDPTFALVSEVANSSPPRHERAGIALVLMLGLVVASSLELVPLLTASLVTAGLMLLTRCLNGSEARKSVELNVLLAIAASLGIGEALESSGLADHVGQFVARTADGAGPLGVLTTIYVTTVILSAVVTSKAAVALMFPIAVSITKTSGIEIRPVVFLLMMAASANFLTPISYQTNLMVFGPGRYRFADFTRFGLPLQVLVGGVTLTCVYLRWL